MKRFIYISFILTSLTACSLDKDPISEFNEKNMQNQKASAKIETKAQMKSQYEAIYNFMKNAGQEFWVLDFLVSTETRSDNAYAGSTNAELTQVEQNSQDASNKNITRDWPKYLEGVSIANTVISNIDKVPDGSLTQAERRQWKAEARILKAWMLFDMVRFWGAIPLPPMEIPEITSENIDETYKLLYVERSSVEEVYKQIIGNLEEAIAGAPQVQSGNKFILSKAVAQSLLAKVYAEKPMRDYNKTIQYCNDVINSGFTLVADYRDLFAVNDTKTDAKLRNSSESIFEITYSSGGGNWVAGLYGLDHINANSTYAWKKWCTPSLDLIAAYDAEGDKIRKEAGILFDKVSWIGYYPSDNYALMYKIRSHANSVIKLRLADILLLKAEAHAALGQVQEAATLVNQVRARVKLAPIATSLSQEAMKEAVLKERRLELAFEGHRWFDLVRNDKAITIMNTLNSRDSSRLLQIYPLNEQTILSPVPQTELGKNTRLTQNPGY